MKRNAHRTRGMNPKRIQNAKTSMHRHDTNVNAEELIHFDDDTGCYQADKTSYIDCIQFLRYFTVQGLNLKLIKMVHWLHFSIETSEISSK